ncbi:hypothetical protein Cgig2_027776 [Carnegiea gigantea]|uniref:Transmembrane protein n=1 Tax=Carnegiea gigantea TaxID=171969 RepID=A0A9Q1JP92_9CARY|nr:hypothetical protein Cgig2_027776 [Carnegiea gigantea]
MGKNSKSNTITPLMCPHCAGPLSKEMIGSAVGGTTSAFYGFNYVMPTVRKWVKGPMWLHFLIGVSPLIFPPLSLCGKNAVVNSGVIEFSINIMDGITKWNSSINSQVNGAEEPRIYEVMIVSKPVASLDVVSRGYELAASVAPPVIVFSSACAGLAGGAVPALAQLASSSYHAARLSSTISHSSQEDKPHQSRTSSTL